MKIILRSGQNDLLNVIKSLDLENIDTFSQTIVHCLKKGNKVIVCGNGGSVSQAEHFEAELIGLYKKSRRPLPCICLNTAGGSMSCIVNDCGGQHIFSRGVEALAQKGDILLTLTTSGNSENIVQAINAAKKKEVITLALLGKGGGKVKDIVDQSIIVESDSTARIQEIHLFIIHAICEYLEEL